MFVNFRDNQLASCSEDGSVRLWDLRKKENTNILTPHLVDKVARPRFGKWIGAVDFTEDWLVGNNNNNIFIKKEEHQNIEKEIKNALNFFFN